MLYCDRGAIMQAISWLGGSELAVLLLFFGGAGIPLGVPPEKENPLLSHVAPEDCLLYASWAGMAKADPGSKNHTEQLLAEAEVQQFAAALERALTSFMAQGIRSEGDAADKLGKTAPLWIRTLITRPTAIYLTRLEPRGETWAVEGGLIVQAGDSAALLDAALTELLTTENQKPAEFAVGPRKFHKVAASRELPAELSWGAGNGYLMVGMGPGAIEAMGERIRAQKTPAWLTDLVQSAGIERRSSVSYVNVKRSLDTWAPLAGREGEALLAALGLRQIVALNSVAGLDDTGMVSKSRLTIDGPPQGLLAAIESEGIVAGDLAHVPGDAMVSLNVSVDAGKMLDAFIAALAELDPRAPERFASEMAQFESRLGVHPLDAFSALGNNWSIHAAAADGGLMGAVLSAEVGDRAKIESSERKFRERLGKAPLGRGPSLTSTPFAGQTIHHFSSGFGALVSPAWCVTEKRLFVGLYPQAVKAVLSRQPGEKSLAMAPEVVAALAGPKPPLAVGYYDSKAMFEAVYPSLQMVFPILANQMRYSRQPIGAGGFVPPHFDPAQLPPPRTISRHLQPSTIVLRSIPSGVECEMRQTLPVTNVGASAPVAVALLLPGLQAMRLAQYQSRSSNNLKQQLLAMHNFHDTYRHFPAAFSVNADGKPLLSWRVHLLPFLEQSKLFEEFHLDEPWDSEHNKKLIARMPEVYLSPRSKSGPGQTTYLGVGGQRGVLIAPTRGRGDWRASHAAGAGMADITDGTSNTIALVEASDAAAVIWTKPEEWAPDAKDPLKGLIGARPEGFLAAACDGSVHVVARTIPPATLLRLFGRNEGEVASFDEVGGAGPRR